MPKIACLPDKTEYSIREGETILQAALPISGQIVSRASSLTDDYGLVCRFHKSCFDLVTGAVREWAPTLQGDGTSKGWEFLGDVSRNCNPLRPLPCQVHEGSLWVALD